VGKKEKVVDSAALAWWRPALACLRPPPAFTISTWADARRLISPEFSAEPGQWSTGRCEFMRAVMDAASPSHPARRVVLMKASQVGGTESLILNTIGFTIDVDPRSILVVFPTVDLAEGFAKERLEPMVAMMPALRVKVAEVRSGAPGVLSERSTLRSKTYPGGVLNLVGANSVSGLSSRPVPMAMMDEVDACVANSGAAGNPIKLLTARTSTFADSKKEIFLGSPSLSEDESGILQLWEDSSRGRLETSCPACGVWQVLDFARLDTGTALHACRACGVESSQWQWNGREDGERWTHEVPGHPTQGFRLSGLNSPWLDWRRDLCAEFLEAHRVQEHGDESLMKVFVNTRLAEPYRVLGRRVEVDLYDERREHYPCHEKGADVPDGVLLITAAVDTHDSHLVYEVVGWGRGRESWGIEYGMIAGDPRKTDSGVFEKLDEVVYHRVFKFADGTLIRPRIIFIDSGGHATTQVYQYAAKRHPRVFAIKGVGGDGKPMIIGGRVRDKTSGAWLLRLGVNGLKEEVHSRLNVAAPGPGFCHWPCGQHESDVCGYSESYFKELIAEQRILKYSTGGFAKYEWHKARFDDNESFDLRCYARAALEYLRVRLEQMTRDELRGLNPKSIEAVETVEGQEILNYKGTAGARKYELRMPSKAISALSEVSEETKTEREPRAPVEMPRRRQVATERYGGVSSLF
jgi:phage terminase large subunit GpA-like protein